MKKVILFLCLILSSLGFAGCSCNKSQITYADKSISIYENEIYTIEKDKVSLIGDDEYIVYILDENIAKIEDFVVYPLSEGKTKIRFELVSKKDVFFDVNLEVKKGKVAKGVSIEKSVVNMDITDGVKTAINNLIYDGECDEIPIVTYTQEIVTYDYATGIITALGDLGKVKVSVHFSQCSVSFDVNITQDLFVTTMVVNNSKVYANTIGKIPFQVFPNNANTYAFSLSSDEKDRDDFIIYSDGSYKSFGATKINLVCTYYTQKNLKNTISFELEIVEKITDFNYSIKDERGATVRSCLVNGTYTLILEIDKNLGEPILQIFGDFAEKSTPKYVEKTGYEIIFKFTSIGVQEIDITYSLTLGNIQNIVNKTITLSVTDMSSIAIGAKWGSLTLEKDNLDRYNIYLDGENGTRADYITILLKIDGNFEPSLQYTVYQVIDATTKIEVDKKFTPTEVGEFTFEVVYNGKTLGQIVVLVK